MPRLTIYCEQYGYYWKLSPKQFLAMCARAMKAGFHDIPGQPLARRPASIAKERGAPHRRAFSTDSAVMLFHTLDWDKGDYKQAYYEVARKIRGRK